MSTEAIGDGLSVALFGKTRRVVLGLLLGRPDESFYLRQVVRATGLGLGAVQRELHRLARAGILSRHGQGRQVDYQANRRCPIFAELHALAIKTAGVADVLRGGLQTLADRIRVAFVYGSTAKGSMRAGSDVDLLVIGDLSLAEVVAALGGTQERLGREVNPIVYPPSEFAHKLAQGHHFLATVLGESKIFLLGGDDELAGLAQSRVGQRTSNQSTRNRRSTGRRRP
jgi:hypothetical protein